eukprot:Skav209218  [mRNA]  locus=scaffold603:47568:60977:+ [translate_table: standard]
MRPQDAKEFMTLLECPAWKWKPAEVMLLSVGEIKKDLRPAAEEDHKIFVASVLNNFQLMARFTRFMRQAHEFWVKSDEDGVSPAFVVEATKADAGRCVSPGAAVQWKAPGSFRLPGSRCAEAARGEDQHSSPLMLGSCGRSAGKSFGNSKEIAALRDGARNREDPLDQLPDIRYFYEPLKSLDTSEQKFMIDLIREVLKMMVLWPPILAVGMSWDELGWVGMSWDGLG